MKKMSQIFQNVMLSVDGDEAETNIRQRGDVGGSAKKVGKRIKELERIYGIRHGAQDFQGNQYSEVSSNNFKSPQKTQEQLASDMGITVQTLQNYKMMAEMIPELEDLMDTGIVTKTTALAKQRKVAVEYVKLCGFEQGGDRKSKARHGLLNLDEIAHQLGISKTNLKRALSIERNLTDSMKELLDTAATLLLFSVSPLRKENVIITRRRREKIS